MMPDPTAPRPLRAVLAGCGAMSAAWLDAARTIPGLELAGLVDVRLDAAQRRAAEYGLDAIPTGTDLAAMLDRTAPDLVFDCTVPEAHPAVTQTALAHGCHVLGEKPMAPTLAEAQAMVAAAARAGKTYAVIQNRRYDPQIRRLRRFLAGGALGPLTAAHSDFFIGAHFGGFRDVMPHVLLLDMAIHTFDAARFLLGADPVSVLCHEWNPPGSWYARDAAAVAIFEMTGGLVYTYRGSWCAEGLPTAWEAEWRLQGTGGSARWDGAAGFRAQVVTGPGGFQSAVEDRALPPADPADRVGGHAGLLRDFVAAVAAGTVPETVCTDNIKSLAMVFAAIESAQQGQRIPVVW